MCWGTWTQFTISGCCFQEDGRPSQQSQPWAEPSEFGEVLPLPADTVAQAGDKALEVEFWPCLT